MNLPSVDATIGHHVARLRAEHGITQDQLKTRVRAYGLRWSLPRVGQYERGEVRTTVEIWLALAVSLSDLTAMRVNPLDLLGDRGIAVTESWASSAQALVRLFIGDFENVNELPVSVAGQLMPDREVGKVSARLERVRAQISEAIQRYPDLPIETVLAVTGGPSTLAEERAAARLKVPTSVLRAWAYELWGLGIDDEAQRRAGEGASAQARGHVTRRLTDEVREAMEALDGAPENADQ